MRIVHSIVALVLLTAMVSMEVSRNINFMWTTEIAKTGKLFDIFEEENEHESRSAGEDAYPDLFPDDVPALSHGREALAGAIVSTHDLSYPKPCSRAVFPPPEI